MAAVPVEIRGTLYDLASKSSRQVFIIGEAARSDLSVGGGPIVPGEPPPGIWGPTDPRPTPPIHLPGGGGDTGIWGPTDPRPGYGLPKPPEGYPNPPEGNKPPPADGGWGYVGETGYGWAYYPGPTEARPK